MSKTSDTRSEICLLPRPPTNSLARTSSLWASLLPLKALNPKRPYLYPKTHRLLSTPAPLLPFQLLMPPLLIQCQLLMGPHQLPNRYVLLLIHPVYHTSPEPLNHPQPFATFSSAASPFSNVPGSSTSAFGAAPVVSPASFEPLPVSKPNLQALQMQGPPAAPTSDEQAEKVTPHTKSLLSHFKRPPSPASSIMAETGSTYEPSHTRRSSLSSTTSHATEDTKPTSTDDTSKATAPSPRKPALSGFTSQASAASPFARAGAAASDSPFAHKPATAPSKPSSLGGFSGFSSPFSKATAPTATASSSAASASPFAKMASSPGLKPTHPTDQSVASAQEDADKAGSSNHKDFGTMLKDSGAAAASVPPAVSNEKIEFKELDEGAPLAFRRAFKVSVTHVPMPVITGEECENTRFSSRCKLFVMEGDGYREAGLGALRINQNTSSNKPSYRLRWCTFPSCPRCSLVMCMLIPRSCLSYASGSHSPLAHQCALVQKNGLSDCGE